MVFEQRVRRQGPRRRLPAAPSAPVGGTLRLPYVWGARALPAAYLGNVAIIVTQSCLTLDARYRLEARIAGGGVGQVWRGTDLLLRRQVAVKMLRPEYADHPETLGRFRAEAQHAGAMTHRGIAQVYDYCDGGPSSSPYLVLEFVDGPSLAGILARGPIGATRTMDIIAQVAAGLAAAHRAGLAHRDIKPENILLGPDGLVKITDFGIAHAAGSAPVTPPDLVMGTSQYLAPERITGRHESPVGDLYSLGIVLYECLVGKPPFDGTWAEVMSAHLHRPMPSLPPGVPDEIRELLARLTAKDPAERLADAAEVEAVAGRLSARLSPAQPDPAEAAKTPETASAAAEPGLAAGPATMTGDTSRPAGDTSKRRVLAATAAAGMLAAVAGVLFFVMPTGAAPVEADTGHGASGQAGPAATARMPASSGGAVGGSGQQGVTPSPNPAPSPSGTGPQKSPSPAASTPSATKSPHVTPTPTPSSSGSGIQLKVPILGITLGL